MWSLLQFNSPEPCSTAKSQTVLLSPSPTVRFREFWFGTEESTLIELNSLSRKCVAKNYPNRAILKYQNDKIITENPFIDNS